MASHPHHFTPGKETLCPLNKRLNGTEIRSGHTGEGKNLLPIPG